MRACLNGIAKADIALRESKGDSDIQCVALIKRAELIFIAVKFQVLVIISSYVLLIAAG